MFLCPRECCKARVSWPSLASLNPQAWRSMCGWMGNGILAVSPTRWMRRWKPMGLIGPPRSETNTWASLGQFDLLPLQVADLRCPQTVAIGDKDHGRVAMPVAAVLARAVHQALDLTLGEIASLDCQVYGGWSAVLGSRFHRGKTLIPDAERLTYTRLL